MFEHHYFLTRKSSRPRLLVGMDINVQSQLPGGFFHSTDRRVVGADALLIVECQIKFNAEL